jgi:hypothetical protein
MTQERETPKFQGIADPQCRCTPDRLCRWCNPSARSDAAISYKTPDQFRGKFREPWTAAVKYNNDEIKNGGKA